MKSNPAKQQGAALISALLIMAIAVSLATWLYLQQHLLLRQARAMMQADALTLKLQEARAWALRMLITQKDLRQMPTYHVQQAGVDTTAMIFAEGGRFNLNVLESNNHVLHAAFLLQAVLGSLAIDQTVRMSYDISNWLSSTSRLDRYYLGLNPPYRQGHTDFASLSELRLVRGFTAKMVQKLVKGPVRYLTVLPTHESLIDVNYVSSEVLASMTSLTTDEAKRVIRCRDASPFFNDVNDFIQRCGGDLNIEADALTTQSAFFLFKGRAEQGTGHQVLTSMLQIVNSDKGPSAKIIWQEYNDE